MCCAGKKGKELIQKNNIIRNSCLLLFFCLTKMLACKEVREKECPKSILDCMFSFVNSYHDLLKLILRQLKYSTLNRSRDNPGSKNPQY